MTSRLITGDCAEVLKTFSDTTFDALVTDPPGGIGFMGKDWDSNRGGRSEWIAWLAGVMRECLRVLKPGAHGLVWAIPRTSHWTAMALEDAGFEIRDRVSHLFATGFPKSLTQRTGLPAGCGTALKPACEDWWLVRKPLAGTVRASVETFGTGALNIDACRLSRPAGDRTEYGVDGDEGCGSTNAYAFRPEDRRPYNPDAAGRWPTNVTLDEGAAAALDAQASASDGASRFFFVAKASRKERDAGCDDLPVKTGGEATGRKDGSAGVNNPRAGAGRTGGARNHHPTVKSIELMRWLCRLITPPGGVVLDPFMGSGSTGVACAHEGLHFVGIEAEPEYMKIAQARVSHASVKPR